jgi:hypothetical protein
LLSVTLLGALLVPLPISLSLTLPSPSRALATGRRAKGIW